MPESREYKDIPEAEVGKLWPTGQIWLLPGLVNKVSVEEGHPHPCMNSYGYFCTTMTELRSLRENIWPFRRKSLQT